MRTPKSRPEAVENLVLSLGLVALLVCGLARWAELPASPVGALSTNEGGR